MNDDGLEPHVFIVLNAQRAGWLGGDGVKGMHQGEAAPHGLPLEGEEGKRGIRRPLILLDALGDFAIHIDPIQCRVGTLRAVASVGLVPTSVSEVFESWVS